MNRRVPVYALELVACYALAFAVVYMLKPTKAPFQAGLAMFFVVLACVIGRPALPHDLAKLLARPVVLLMSVVVVGFGVFGRNGIFVHITRHRVH